MQQDIAGQMRGVLRSLYAMRNGIVADALRRGGSPYRLIMGVNLPQLKEIAARTVPSVELAEALWARTSSREAQLIAPMLMPQGEMDHDRAIRWLAEAPCAETIDILCHTLLRKMPYAADLALELISHPGATMRYAALRLMWCTYGSHGSRYRAAAAAEADRHDPVTERVALQLVEELDLCYGRPGD